MGVGGVYREIARPERLSHTEKFDMAWYPGEALITTVLSERGGTPRSEDLAKRVAGARRGPACAAPYALSMPLRYNRWGLYY